MIINNPTMSTNAVIIKTKSLPMLITNGHDFPLVESHASNSLNADSPIRQFSPVQRVAPLDRRHRPTQ